MPLMILTANTHKCPATSAQVRAFAEEAGVAGAGHKAFELEKLNELGTSYAVKSGPHVLRVHDVVEERIFPTPDAVATTTKPATDADVTPGASTTPAKRTR